MNHTELYQMCNRAGIAVHPGTDRRWLMAYLMGTAKPPPIDNSTHPISAWRFAIISFLRDYWHQVQPQLRCPARRLMTDNPNPCFGCLDAQVISCVLGDPEARNEVRIQQYKPRG